ncbi:hypothetical protein COCCU_02060 [Corynebacterium occultum]|uniref:Uncharacterized protein n=1 Tax=Corynebacterium occultum TaxID=2675219 RepID=A0A6B8W1J4_9CORY|nr:hypothetical protein COCCU_02060 [Corynebacterium occultum]
MGRVLLLILIIVAVVLLWKAFGPKSWKKNQLKGQAPPREIKGPDDDEEFLWSLEKDRFKQRRAREEAAREEAERMKRAQERYQAPPGAAPGGSVRGAAEGTLGPQGSTEGPPSAGGGGGGSTPADGTPEGPEEPEGGQRKK